MFEIPPPAPWCPSRYCGAGITVPILQVRRLRLRRLPKSGWLHRGPRKQGGACEPAGEMPAGLHGETKDRTFNPACPSLGDKPIPLPAPQPPGTSEQVFPEPRPGAKPQLGRPGASPAACGRRAPLCPGRPLLTVSARQPRGIWPGPAFPNTEAFVWDGRTGPRECHCCCGRPSRPFPRPPQPCGHFRGLPTQRPRLSLGPGLVGGSWKVTQGSHAALADGPCEERGHQ